MPTAVEIEVNAPIRGHVLATGIALSSFSALLLELGMTRVFSVVLFYHFAFLAISIALLGLGAGGVFAHLRKQKLQEYELRNFAAVCSCLNALTIPLVLEIVLHVPVSLQLTGGNFIRLSVIYLASAIPFFLTGLQFSVIFARESGRIPRLYSADLAGGSLACIFIVPLLNWVGGPNAILFSALIAAIAAIIWSATPKPRELALASAILLALGIALNHSGRLADITWAKGTIRQNVEFARWNALSRVEVDRAPDGARVIVIDADANTYIMNADPQHFGDKDWERKLMASPPAAVNALRPQGDYAVIGPGGGVDILRAVVSGSPSVTGIEINPIIANGIMRERYAEFAYHLYERPGVHIQVADGRSFIRNSSRGYDVIQMTLVDTWASTAAGAFALSENNLYTSEAFREYFEHLKPEGILTITRWEFRQPREALRVVSQAMDALQRLGATDIERHLLVISQGELNEDGINVAVLAKKTAFTEDELKTVQQYASEHGPLRVLYSPSQPQTNTFTDLIRSHDPAGFSRNYAFNISPVNDNQPFFFFTLKTSNLLRSLSGSGAMDWKVNLGVAVLGMLLVISLLAVLGFLFLPLVIGAGRNGQHSSLFYFVAIGLGYILVEVSFVQRFVLFLGHPTYALTVVVFLMLLSSGAGSFASRKWVSQPARIWFPLVTIAAALLLYAFMLPAILNSLVGAAFGVKLLTSGVLLVPLGFVMGMPFPTGLGALCSPGTGRPDSNAVEWAWAMNAAASVLGSVLAIIIAMQYGLTLTLICGAGTYSLAALLRPRAPRPISPL
jgi:hypothetical protein